MILILCQRSLICEVFETRQVELAAQVQPWSRRILRVLAELVQSLNRAGRVLRPQVNGDHAILRFFLATEF